MNKTALAATAGVAAVLAAGCSTHHASPLQAPTHSATHPTTTPSVSVAAPKPPQPAADGSAYGKYTFNDGTANYTIKVEPHFTDPATVDYDKIRKAAGDLAPLSYVQVVVVNPTVSTMDVDVTDLDIVLVIDGTRVPLQTDTDHDSALEDAHANDDDVTEYNTLIDDENYRAQAATASPGTTAGALFVTQGTTLDAPSAVMINGMRAVYAGK